MRRIIFFVLLGLGLSSCQKEVVVEEKLESLMRGQKLAAIIPPVSNPSVTLRRSKNVCINSAQANFDTLYVNGNNTKVHTTYMADTTVGVHLDYMSTVNGILRYKFIKGNRYTITIPVKYSGKDKSGFLSVTSKTYMPYFSAFTLKSLNSTNVKDICMSNFSSLKTSNDLTVSSNFTNGDDIPANQSKTHTLTFVANECFEYIGFTFLNNSSDDPKSVYVGSIKIASEPLLQFNGEELMCIDDIQTISYGAAGFTVSDPVYWHTTGDLEIIGSNYGATVQVKSIGGSGGTVGLNSCSNAVDASNINFNIKAGNTTLNGTIVGNPLIQYTETYDLDYSIELKDGYTDFNWTVSGSSNVVVTKLNNNTARLSVVGVVPFGTSTNIYLRARGIGKCGTSVNEVTKIIRLVYDRH